MSELKTIESVSQPATRQSLAYAESIDKVVAMQEYQDVLVRAAALGSIATAVIDVTV